ncbi:MAG: nitronate monooxygenase [Dehalococcoidia bacterium]|nr:nitronate monooxygenase [Dehalococcoidia bacterium]
MRGGHSGKIASTVSIPEAAEAVNIAVVAAGGFCDGKGLAAAFPEWIDMGIRFAITQERPMPVEIKKRYIEAKSEDAVTSTD